ncbi:doublesex- and mab-3-related transcription factor C2-like [Erinaceus europaeus]|uniref:Doublesex- and mab-3-related transcription factor C2-like n=1 Tax=Erinaceus europaeus TaxID=9365 RepID=A0ABM3WQC6_ERIEU|nr:doublesex- and mab-3-related transcription factor C2-like [Erinaceus europaeus]
MDNNEIHAEFCYTSNSSIECETRAPWGIELDPRRAVNQGDQCHNRGSIGQIKEQEHFCFFQTCRCHKCTFFSGCRRIWPTESTLKMEQEMYLNGHLTEGSIQSGPAPLQTDNHVQKSVVQAGVTSKVPRDSADDSFPRIFVSALDSSTLEEATNNFSYQETPETLCIAPHDLNASDQDIAALEWQRKLEAAEALLTLRNSFQDPPESVSVLQPSPASVSAEDKEVQSTSPCLRPRLASSVSLPIGHLGCISLLS